MKNKLSLKELSIKSFVTDLEAAESQRVYGASGTPCETNRTIGYSLCGCGVETRVELLCSTIQK